MSHTRQIAIRPQQNLYWIALLGFLLFGVISAGKIYGRGGWCLAAAFFLVVINSFSDRIVFDGERIYRRNLWTWLSSFCGLKHEIAINKIDTITSYPVKARHSEAQYRTMICGAGFKWTISSERQPYRKFIKSLLSSVSTHQLDPLSSELLNYWCEKHPSHLFGDSDKQKVLRWRKLANSLSLEGNLDTSSQYFKLAYEKDPNNAHLIYEMARFIRRSIAIERKSANSQQILRAIERAESYLKLAGRIACKEKNAALLERIGETFFELQQPVLARQYFEMVTQFELERPRTNIGLAGMALQQGQVAKAVYHYSAAARGAREANVESLTELAGRKADYYSRLTGDDQFLQSEASRQCVLNQLKWGRRVALALFCGAWFMQLSSFQITNTVQILSREISATALVMWIITSTATYLFSQRRS